MQWRIKLLSTAAAAFLLMAFCSCNRYNTLESLSAPHTTDMASSTENGEENTIVGLYLFTYYTQGVYDSYSDSVKDVQISEFYPIDFAQDMADVTLSTQIREQYFSDDHAKMTYVCLADGQLCDMTYDDTVQNYLTQQYHINETYLLDYSLHLQNRSGPLVGITICTDADLPQTEEQWLDWSRKSHFLNGELIPCTESPDDNTSFNRQNISFETMAAQTYPLPDNDDETVYLKISDSAFEQMDFTENWNTTIKTGDPLYLYCSVPSEDCSLFLFVDDMPAAVFNGACGMDITCDAASQFMRTEISAPAVEPGSHSAFLLLLDHSTMQLHKSTPILLTYGDVS